MGSGRVPGPLGASGSGGQAVRGVGPVGAKAQDGSPEVQIAISFDEFKAKVLERQIRNAIKKGRQFCANVPDSELAIVEDKHRMRTKAAERCKQLLEAARTALAEAKQQGDELAKNAGKLGVYSAYRNIPEDTAAWESSFRQYYEETRVKRAAFATGEHGRQALALMTNMMISYKAAPGYSNHSNGLAVDFFTMHKGKKLRAKKAQKAAWSDSWLFAWLQENAPGFEFKNLDTEEWHWDYIG